MKISIIGSGNVATVFAKLISNSNHRLIHVFSRTLENAAELATQYGAGYSDYNGMPGEETDLYIIATSDQSFEQLLPNFSVNNHLIVHTAGSISKDILHNVSTNYGVLYPLQSLHKTNKNLPEIPLLIDANTEENIEALKNFALSISNNVSVVGDQERFILHAAAVIVSNFTNYLYSIAEDFCIKENADFNLLKPLIMETAQRIASHSPKEVQTGPAIRKDIQTLDKHLRLLNKYPKLRTTYMRLTDGIMNPF